MKFFIKSKNNRGMTMVELLVVLSIFSIISMTVAFNYNGYKSSTSTQVLSQDVALSIREAQGYAIGVKSANSTFPWYGVHFSVNEVATMTMVDKLNMFLSSIATRVHAASTPNINGDSKSFVLFADVNQSRQYDNIGTTCGFDSVVVGSECVSITTISGSDKIAGFCIDSGCNDPMNIVNGSLDIVFRRPNPDAQFCYSLGTSGCLGNPSSVGVIVQSESSLGMVKKIIVWNTGQISVK